MDIYGYTYPFTESDEVVKQMYAERGLTLPFPRSIQGPHSMPVPPGTPWNIQGLSWGMQSPPQLVQFSAQHPESDITPIVVHCKRKSLDLEPVIPAKQLITAEKMAAHLSGLHISSDYTAHTFTSDEMMDVMDTTLLPASSDSCIEISERLKGHTIVLSEEAKMIKEEPLIPAAIIERLEKPTMSLVVWKPRQNILEKIKEEENQNKEETKIGNEILVPDDDDMNDIEM